MHLRPLLALASIATLAAGCRPPEAPANIEDMMVYGFDNFDNDDPDYLVALGENLIAYMDDAVNMEGLADGYEISSLGQENLDGAGVDRVVEGDGIVGAVVGLDYRVDITLLADGLTAFNQQEIFSTYQEFERVADTDRDCFLAHDPECEYHHVHDDVQIDLGVLGIEMHNQFDASFRWVEMPDGSVILAHRNLGPIPVEISVDWFEVYQQYSFTLSYLRPDGVTRRAQAIWVDGAVLADGVGEGTQLTIGINSMKSSAEDLEAYLRGETEEEPAEE